MSCLENCQKCHNFKVIDKIVVVTAKQTPNSCSSCQN